MIGFSSVEKGWLLTPKCFKIEYVEGGVLVSFKISRYYDVLPNMNHKILFNEDGTKKSELECAEIIKGYRYDAEDSLEFYAPLVEAAIVYIGRCPEFIFFDSVLLTVQESLFFLNHLFYRCGLYILPNYDGITTEISRLATAQSSYQEEVTKKILLLLRANKVPKELLSLVCEMIWLKPFKILKIYPQQLQ